MTVFIYHSILGVTKEVPAEQLPGWLTSGWVQVSGPANPNFPAVGDVFSAGPYGEFDFVTRGDLAADAAFSSRYSTIAEPIAVANLATATGRSIVNALIFGS